MNINYLAVLIISFVPLLTAAVWYRPKVGFVKILITYFLSCLLISGFAHVIIHQLGFYGLFKSDIILGVEGASKIVEEFLEKYGDKHRGFWHGTFHGVVNSFVFALPFISFFALLENRNWQWVGRHFSYWLVTSILVGGLISEFV